MKIKFTETELAYLNEKISICIAYKRHIEPSDARALAKMRYKFTPNASLVSLTARERSFIESLVQYRLNDLMNVNSITPEAQTCDAIKAKVTL